MNKGKSYLESVKEFHRRFEHPIKPEPVIPEPGLCRLRVNLLQEELNELKRSIDEKDLVEIADALCDLQYVLSGAVLSFGLGDLFDEMFEAVHKSNMSKACPDLETAQKTAAYYKHERGFECDIVARESSFFVLRVPDGKILKSIDYNPVDLHEILKKWA